MSTAAAPAATRVPSPVTEPRRGPDLAFLALVGAFLVYAAVFIWQTSFLIGGERYFSLFDDAMVSMRYARNLAEGHGLVWNPGGERVEGFTNPLWTFFMAGVHRLPLPESKLSLVVQLAGVLLLAANLFVVRALAVRTSGGSRAAALAAALFTAFYLPLNNWTLQGMEVGLLALIVTAAALAAVRAMEAGRFSVAPYLLLGMGTLVRPDGVVPFLAVLGFLFLADRPRRWRHLAIGVAILVVCMAGQTALRVWYYGDPLPNTYYLKMTGYPALLRITRGAWVLLDTVWYANPLLFCLPLVLLFTRRTPAVLLPLALLVGQMAYSTYVGGDAWEWWGGANRYVVVAMPAYFAVLATALRDVFRAGADAAERRRIRVSPRARGLAWAALVAFAAVSLNALKGPRSLPEWVLADRPMHVEDNEQMVRVALLLRERTPPDARVAVRWAGATPYFARRETVDLLGKADLHVARLPMQPPAGGFHRFIGFWPGHMKWDYAYSIQQLRPDVVWNKDYDGTVLPHLAGYHPVRLDAGTVYVRDDSPVLAGDARS